MSDEQPKQCSKCGKKDAGPGGVLCPGCKTAIEAQVQNPWNKAG